MNKKIISLSIILAIVFVLSIAFTACQKEEQPVHTHNFDEKWLCDDDGHQMRCSECEALDVKKAHIWSEVVKEIRSTCVSKGSRIFTCTECGYKKSEPIEKIPHDYSGRWLSDASGHRRLCAMCSGLSQMSKHTFDGDVCVECGYDKGYKVNGTKGLIFAPTKENDSYIVTGYNGNDIDVEIPDEYNSKKVTYIDYEAFEGNTMIRSVIIGDNVTSIGYNSFKGCAGLQKVIMGDGITEIEGGAFYGCYALKEVVFSKSLSSIGGSAFYQCRSLSKADFPLDLSYIGGGAFEGCESLSDALLKENVSFIGDWAFRGCEKLTEMIIPDKVTFVGKSTFRDCKSLSSIVLSPNTEIIEDWAFRGCVELTDIDIPGSVKSIGYGAFYDCSGLINVYIGDGLTDIGEWAFRNCLNLKSIEFPGSIKYIGNGAFNNCKSLQCIYYSGTSEQWQKVNCLGSNLTVALLYYYSKTDPKNSENYNLYFNYWHYGDNGEIEIWK